MSKEPQRKRDVLPIPDSTPVGVTTYDAKDPDTAFPPIEQLRPAEGAPNVLIILIDDVGFGASSAFGGPISTPGLDETTMVSYIEEALNSAGLMVPVLAIFTLLPIGLVVLAVGLTRASVVPAWVAWLMPIGIIGIAGSLQYTVLLVLSALALIASFGYVGLRLLRAPDATLAEARPA